VVDPLLVWWSQLDGRYLVEVVRDDPERPTATLRIFDHLEADLLVVDQPVLLTYGAAFGPDIADVADWQRRAIEIVDGDADPARQR
jgi:hypothetical protein